VIAKGCGGVMENRRKVTKEVLIWQMVLRKWVSEKWVDIGSKRKDGSYAPCGRSKGEKRKGYPKCVPLAKARSMSEGQRRSAVHKKKSRRKYRSKT
jgi:hypothetical protein